MHYCNMYEILHMLLDEFEDIKGVMKIRISKKDRQNNGQKKTYKMTNNDIQSTTQKTKDRTARTSLNTGVR